MRIAWFPLFRLRVRHGFYADGESRDFGALPSEATARELSRLGLRFHPFSDGFGVFAEVDPGTLPHGNTVAKPAMRSLQGDEALRLQFHLPLRNPYFVNFSDLPEVRPGAQVFYFNNLRDDPAPDRLHLGDSVLDARVGEPVSLITGAGYTHRLATAAKTARLVLTDIFGRPVHVEDFDFSGAPEPTRELRLDLSAIDAVVPGRYRVTDDQGGTQDVFYAPETFRTRPFAVVELFTTTTGIVAGADKVPATYRVFEGSRIRRVKDLAIQWEPRRTIWRYSVTKKYDKPPAGIGVDSLQIGDGTGFSTALGGTENVVFTATGLRPLSEQPADLVLNHNGSKKIRKLPSPRPATPLKKETVAAIERDVSELFIYI